MAKRAPRKVKDEPPIARFGWLDWPEAVEMVLSRLPAPLFADAGRPVADTGAGKVVLLYEAARKVMGRDLDPGPQKIGDCVSWGYGGSCDLVACVQAAQGQGSYSWDVRTCTEAVYALSRCEYGNFDGSYSDGSTGAWAAEAVSKGGILSRARLGPYDPQRAKQWGAKGLPDELEPEARQHLVRTVSLVTSYEQARDAISNGYPVPVCSTTGFEGKRDKKGFIRPKGQWGHCMKFVGVDDSGSRPALLCMNSWGNDHEDEPKGEHDIPDNAWWVDADVAEGMLRRRDSFALSNFDGYPQQDITWTF